MFLKKVYRHSKLMFGGMLFFVLAQLFISYKHGIVFSPWYNYGMFSGPIPVRQTYAVQYLAAPDGSRLSPQRWDQVHYTLSQFEALPANDSIYRQLVQRIYPRLFFHAPNPRRFRDTLPPASFDSWYRNYISKILHTDPAAITIAKDSFYWDGNRLLKHETK